MNIPRQLDLPCAWKGAELAKTPERWTHELDAITLAEIENAIAEFASHGLPIEQISPATFPLPSFANELKSMRHELQHGLGFTLMRGLPVANYSNEQVCTIFCGIGSYLGMARSQNAHGHLLGHVRDVDADINDANVRIYQTAKRQTFHTDSSDAVGLLCLQEAMEGGDSLLMATATLYNEMMKREPELLQALFKPIATDRRGEVPEGANPYFMIPVFNWHDEKLTALYQRMYIESASRFTDAPRPLPEQIKAMDLLDEISNDPEFHLRMRLQAGDMQFVYNHSNLHDRTAFRDWPEPEKRRHLLRLWLALPDDRELPPVFSQRYGPLEIGDRGGIIVPGTQLNVPLMPHTV